MKSVSKLLGAVGVAGAVLASAPASAVLTLEFFNGAGTSLGFAQSLGNELTLTGRINNWNISVNLGTSANPAIGLSLTGNMFRDASPLTNFLQCTPNAIDPNPCSINSTGFQFVSGMADVGSDGTLKVRVNDDNVPVSASGVYNLLETLSTARQVTRTYNAQLILGGPGGFTADNLNIALDNNNPYSNNYVYAPGATPIGITAGVDLVAGTAIQDVNTGFFYTYEVGQRLPEPGSLALLGLGLVGVVLAKRRRKAVA